MTRTLRTTVVVALAGAWVVGAAVSSRLGAQTGGAGTGGLTRLAQEERLAGNWRRVLMIGAHPDDEDTELLTILARGQGIETAYLSLTRGDGGQNLIGSELGAALGVLRTEELATARRIDGGRQFFTRAVDFGFSKTAEETLRFWNRDSVLKDMVRIIRRFRPQVIVSVWSGTPADGHGHHQASGTLSLEAYHAAGDSTRFPELGGEGLLPWRPGKFYRSAGRGGGGNATLTFDGGVIDPATGHSLRQLAARSRSQHRSQNQGNLEELGPSRTGVRLEERAPGITGPDDSLFAGIAPERVDGRDVHSSEVALIQAGVVLDATTSDAEVTPGQVLFDTLTAWNTGPDTVRVAFMMPAHAGFTSHSDQCPASTSRPVAPGAVVKCVYTTTVASDAKPNSPYYLDLPADDGFYQWSGDPAVWGEPSAPALHALFSVAFLRRTIAGDTVTASREVQARSRDPVLGEVRRPVMIVPSIAVSLEPNHLLWPVGVRSRPFTVALEHLARGASDATVSLLVPGGWTVGPAQPMHFARKGERANVSFTVTAPANVSTGTHRLAARVIAGNDTFTTGLQRIRYPHVRDQNIATTAVATVVVAPAKFAPVGTIGYVRGGGDQVPEAMSNAGLPVTLLTGDALERGPLDQFKVIVIGPRAYEADESLARAQPRLIRWLEAGGTLVVQYQQQPYMNGGFAPKPFTLLRPTQNRVTDETAAVTVLAPAHQVMLWPNAIGSGDFDDWVQERGLDFAATRDPAWTAILSMHDPGEQPLDGGLLVAKVGKGTAVYTGLAFHRQLPAVVPGAWRLWANILAAGQAATKPVLRK